MKDKHSCLLNEIYLNIQFTELTLKPATSSVFIFQKISLKIKKYKGI